MDNTYLAYIAGFLDGEGCITMVKVYRKDPRNKNPRYKEEFWGNVSVGMADPEPQRIL